MKFLNLIRCAFGLAAASLLASCGGGGAESRPVDAGVFSISPATATWYAGTTEVLKARHRLDPWVISAGVAFRF